GEGADRGDDRLRAAIHRGAEVDAAATVAEPNRYLRRDELADVGAGGEGALAGAGHHDDARVLAPRQLAEAGGQFLAHALVHRIVHGGPVERDRRDAVGQLVADRLVRHRSMPPQARAGRRHTPRATSPAISSSVAALSRRTASVCSPSVGGGPGSRVGVPVNAMGWPITRSRPTSGCSYSRTMSWWRTAGCCKIGR